MGQGLRLGIREQCSGFLPRERLSVTEEHVVSSKTLSPAKTEASCHLQSQWELLSGKGEVTSTPVLKRQSWRATQEEEFRETLTIRIPYGRPGRSVLLGAFIFPTVVFILVMISVSVSHIAFVLLLQTYFAGYVFFRIILRSVISMIYCPLVFISLSQFYLFFSHCLTF